MNETLHQFNQRLVEKQKQYDKIQKEISILLEEKDIIENDIEEIIVEMRSFQDNIFEALSPEAKNVYDTWVW